MSFHSSPPGYLCCMSNYPKPQGLKATIVPCSWFCDCRMQEELNWGFWLRSRLYSSQNLTGAIVVWKFHRADAQNISLLWLAVDAGSRLRTQLGHSTRASPCGLSMWLEVLSSWRMGSEGCKRQWPRARIPKDTFRRCMPPSNLASEVTQHHFCTFCGFQVRMANISPRGGEETPPLNGRRTCGHR